MRIKICPICAGVSLTWLLILAGLNLDWLAADDWLLIAAIAMGGTVVGIAYQGEKRFGLDGRIYRFKVPVILAGFWLANFALTHISWMTFWVDVTVLVFVGLIFFVSPILKRPSAADLAKVDELEKKLSDCC